MYDKIFKAIRKHSRTPLKISHSPYYTQLLDEYQSRSSEIFYYGLVSIIQIMEFLQEPKITMMSYQKGKRKSRRKNFPNL